MKDDIVFKRIVTIIIIAAVALLFLTTTPVIIYLVLTSKINIDTITILSFLVAFFSIGISLAFYFQTTKASDVFQNKAYNLMKDQMALLQRNMDLLETTKEMLNTRIGGVEETIKELSMNTKALDGLSKVVMENDKSISQELNDVKDKTVDSTNLQKLLEERQRLISEQDEIITRMKSAIENNESLMSSDEIIPYETRHAITIDNEVLKSLIKLKGATAQQISQDISVPLPVVRKRLKQLAINGEVQVTIAKSDSSSEHIYMPKSRLMDIFNR